MDGGTRMTAGKTSVVALPTERRHARQQPHEAGAQPQHVAEHPGVEHHHRQPRQQQQPRPSPPQRAEPRRRQQHDPDHGSARAQHHRVAELGEPPVPVVQQPHERATAEHPDHLQRERRRHRARRTQTALGKRQQRHHGETGGDVAEQLRAPRQRRQHRPPTPVTYRAHTGTDHRAQGRGGPPITLPVAAPTAHKTATSVTVTGARRSAATNFSGIVLIVFSAFRIPNATRPLRRSSRTDFLPAPGKPFRCQKLIRRDSDRLYTAEVITYGRL